VYTSKRREMVTALHVAVDMSLYGNVEALLNHNADANIFDHNNETALHVAVRKADCVMTHMLLAKGAVFAHISILKIASPDLDFDLIYTQVYTLGHTSTPF